MDVSTKTLSIFEDNAVDSLPVKTVTFKGNKNLLELLNEHKISINQSCGGFGSCTTCRVIVRSNLKDLQGRNEIEQERASERRFCANERLACQLDIQQALEIIIP